MLSRLDNPELFDAALLVFARDSDCPNEEYYKMKEDGVIPDERCEEITSLYVEGNNIKGVDNLPNLENLTVEAYLFSFF